MNKKLYRLMDWAAIEEVTYGECSRPSEILGAHAIGRQMLVQCFFPGALKVNLQLLDKKAARGKLVKDEIPMELADEAGFFAALISTSDAKDYRYQVVYGDSEKIIPELYGKGRILEDEKEEAFISGSDLKAYEYMGGHKKTVRGIRGSVFRVYAPGAVSVSLLCRSFSFNGLQMPMDRLPSGIYELFVPGIEAGEEYCFEVVMKDGTRIRKADPFALYSPGASDGLSVIADLSSFSWKDAEWIKKRNGDKLNIYEISLPSCISDDGFDIKDLAASLALYAKNMGYTHVSLRPFMEYEKDEECGYGTVQFFAPYSRFGTPDDYREFVNILHENGIGVIAQWNFREFSNVSYGLAGFDGTALYEYSDHKRGFDKKNGRLVFDLSDDRITGFLSSALFYLLDGFHFDGIEFKDVSAALYLDYYKAPDEWTPNIYGGVEDLQTIDFLKAVNAMIHKNFKGVFTIAEENSGYSTVTGTGDESLGFDHKSDIALVNTIADYLSHDPIDRKYHHNELTDSMLYQFCEDYICPVSVCHLDNLQGGMINRMHGNDAEKKENLKLLYAYMAFHTGSMSVFMGEEAGNKESFEAMRRISITPSEDMKLFRDYMRALNSFKLAHNSVFSTTSDFEWISENDVENNVLSFVRRSAKEELFFVFNFSGSELKKFETAVPADGKYEEIFDSAAEAYGGEDNEVRFFLARDKAVCGRDASLAIRLKPLSVLVFSYVPYSKEEKELIEKRKALKIKKKEEARKKRIKLDKAKEAIRSDIRSELERKIYEAEEAIAAGSEYKKKNGRKQS